MKNIYNKVASAFGAYGFNYPDGTTEVNDLGICNWLRAVVRRPWELTGVGNCFDQTLYAFWLLREEGIAREDIKVLICAGTVVSIPLSRDNHCNRVVAEALISNGYNRLFF